MSSGNFGVVEIASKRTTSAPGWAYVPDLGPTAAAAAASAARGTGGRKRAARNLPGLSAHDQSAREEARVLKEVLALDREGNRDAGIAVPTATVKAPAKHTPNVRKILQSQKTFANHLNDFEAQFAQESDASAGTGSAGSGSGHGGGGAAAASGGSSKRSKRASLAATAAVRASAEAAEALRRRASRDGPHGATVEGALLVRSTEHENGSGNESAGAGGGGDGDTDMDSEMLTATTGLHPVATRKHPRDTDPLLESWVPPVPSTDELSRLLAMPARNYLEMRAVWTADDSQLVRYPIRVFCGICGYWGKDVAMADATDSMVGHSKATSGAANEGG
ncbi:hypothetical protein CFO_g2577 [Ceratocystis platani]|uniref:Uncharacterized protein n=1 Tax=Ceratocystis fimbriata f. sp. platani TaxID=88771 RepID=A0A0F8CWR2_CERFI|nr:hypothetical protein CFO_g2577 [Ceratocystis platani]